MTNANPESGLLWYLPTFYGDIRLQSGGTPEAPKTTLAYDKLSSTETEAMVSLREHAAKPKWGRTPWVSLADFPMPHEMGAGELRLDASIEDVQKFLAKALKPGRVLVTAVRFGDGKVEEKREVIAVGAPYRKEGDTTEPAAPTKEELAEKAAAAALVTATPPAKAVTVAAPVQGCPAPDFEQADVRATRVLEAFLTGEQLEDFRRYGQFVSLGHETGHRYVITSRQARTRLAAVGHRSLYDLDEPRAEMGSAIVRRCNRAGALVDVDPLEHTNVGFGRAFCVHDWAVPAAEEMLALHLFLMLPGYEAYLRDIPDTGDV